MHACRITLNDELIIYLPEQLKLLYRPPGGRLRIYRGIPTKAKQNEILVLSLFHTLINNNNITFIRRTVSGMVVFKGAGS